MFAWFEIFHIILLILFILNVAFYLIWECVFNMDPYEHFRKISPPYEELTEHYVYGGRSTDWWGRRIVILTKQKAHDYFENPLKPSKTELMLFKLGYDISEENFEAIFGYYLAENKFKYVITKIIKDFKERKNNEQ